MELSFRHGLVHFVGTTVDLFYDQVGTLAAIELTTSAWR